ncbi:MAG: Riboflavin biosynthesis protein RibD [Bacteroidota bacterium]|jgi:diaminohydroxyphosphoribosylaminopyrimidine deaminase/5-amino-6-(5-phosphoribosylamino)uracil reductase
MIPESKFMERALALAAMGLGKTSPNPMVGAVIVYNGEIIAEGFHEAYGQAHAEVNAINQVIAKYPHNVNEILAEATIYVSLEPCSHFGKTPPCVDLLIKYQLKNVVIGCQDPFEAVNGKGIQKLKDAGIAVHYPFLEKECLSINKRFFTYHQKQRPYIILKWAQSADGFMGLVNERTAISNEESLRISHQWRSSEDAILIGTQTAIVDNPSLTTRNVNGKNPTRIIIDKDLKIPHTHHIFNNDAPTIIFNENRTETVGNIQYIGIEFLGLLPQMMLYQLYILGVQSIIIEGGAFTLNEFIKYNLWDEARIITATHLFLKEGVKSPIIVGSSDSIEIHSNDQIQTIFPL